MMLRNPSGKFFLVILFASSFLTTVNSWSVTPDPYPGITCERAIKDSKESWYPKPGKTWSDKVTKKLAWCELYGDGNNGQPSPLPPTTAASAGVWPNTNTRFYPGIYVYTDKNNPEPEVCTKAYNTMFGGRAKDFVYRDKQGKPKSYLGCFVQVELKKLYKNEKKAPHAYQTKCSRSTTARNPNWNNYNWEYLESFLNLPIVKKGGAKIYLQLQDTYADNSPLPVWMHDQNIGYKYASHYNGRPKGSLALWRRQTQYAMMDLSHALAKRFKGDKRLAGIQLVETFEQTSKMPADYPKNGRAGKSSCGAVANLKRGPAAMRQGRIFHAHGFKEADPNLMVIVMNAAKNVEAGYAGNLDKRDIPLNWGNKPRPAKWGLKDLPGQWGIAINGPLMFQKGCGSKAFGTNDCEGWSLENVQRHALANDRAVSVDSQSNEWKFDIEKNERACCRTGNQNPWGYNYWQGIYAFWPGHAGKERHIPTPSEWIWYYSGKPKKKGAAANSKLGQYGPDPAGVIPAHYFVVRNLPGKVMVSPDNHSNIVDTRTVQNYREAFDRFGPKGTGAMISFPKGY